MVRSSSNGRRMLLDSLQTFEHNANASHENREVIVNTQTNNEHTRKKSSTIWSAGGWTSLQDIERHYGKKHAEAAITLQISVSMFKRICRELHENFQWPSSKRNRDKGFLSARKYNASFQVADGEYASASQSQKAFPSALRPYSSSCTVIESHQESSFFPIQSNHREGHLSHNHNIETTKGKNMPQGRSSTNKSQQCKARNGSLSSENMMPDSLAKTSRPPQNCMPCDEDSGTSSMSSHKRKRLDKETDCMDEVINFEEPPSEIQSNKPKRQAIVCASKDSSCLSPISGTIEGNNKDYNPNSKSITFMQLDAKSPSEESTLHIVQSRGDCARPDSVQQRCITEHVNLKRKVDTGKDITIFGLGNKQKTNKKSKKTWRIGESVGVEDLKEQLGKKRKEAAESLNVSVSTFKRICRERGISRWPSTKIKRERLLLFSASCNETDRVAANAQMPITRGPTAFASTISVKSNQQKSWSSNLSVNNENGTSLNDNLLGKNEDSDRGNIMIQVEDSANQETLYELQEFEPSCDSLVPAYSFPDAPTILSRLPQERMPAKDATQLKFYAPGQQREGVAKQIEMTDEISQLEKQHLGRERFNRNTGKDVILSVEDSSSYDSRNVSEPIQDHLTDYASLRQLNDDQLISLDDMESTHIDAQSMPESKSGPSIQNDARTIKLIFEKLIKQPLEAISNPNHEASMREVLTILAGNLSLFTDEQAKQLLEFKFDFPIIAYSWRDCSQSRINCQNFLAEFEKTKSLLETSAKEEEDLEDRCTQLESKEKEMMAQLEAIQKEKNEIAKQRSEKFNQAKHLAALAEEQAGRTKEKELQMTIANAKLDKLKSQWVSVQSSFN